jgi:cysteine dioxygenase
VPVLRRLIDDLRACGPLETEGSQVGALLAASTYAWQPRRLLSKQGSYTRTCAYRDARFEVLLLNWAPGAVSPIHDHGDQHCWMIVLDGRLEVEDFVRLDCGEIPGYAQVEARGGRTLQAGEMDTRSGRFDLHRVATAAGSRAVSLHVYSGPLRRYMVYDDLARRCESARGSYDEFLSVYSEPVRR